jgi:hypothetical protein
VPAGTWLGQDGHDYAGGANPLAGNGVQDIHIQFSGLPTNDAVKSVLVLGDGGGGWVYNIGPYYASSSGALFQSAGASTADLYVEPYRVETGRSFNVTVTYNDGATSTLTVAGGTADPNLRMPPYLVSAGWVGQDGRDLTGPSPGVGPDGHVDAHVTVANLFPATAVATVALTDSAGHGWESGTNPDVLDHAEFFRNASDPTRGDLYFSPDHDMAGQSYRLTVTYADGKVDHTSLTTGHTDPNLAMPSSPATMVTWNVVQAAWLGQDGLNLLGAGDVHVAVSAIPAGRSVVMATLSDESGIDWSYVAPGSGRVPPDPAARVLAFRAAADPTRADLTFQPARDETGATLTLTLILDNGSTQAVRLAGDTCDIGLRVPDIAQTSIVAHPGDDLNALANTYGTVRLVAGLYPVGQPIVLTHPVTIEGEPGATLLFSQAATDAPWTTAIKVRASHTTLSGFAVRFAGPIRWSNSVSYGPALIGSTDNFDPWSADPLIDLSFTGLDLQAPPASSSWEEAPHTFRLATATSGLIQNNRIKGGITEIQNGPWQILGNTYLGTLPNTFAYGAFATHYTHDVTIAGNTVAPTGPSGKTWRFLVLTQSGTNDVVSNNTVVGVGPMDSDTVPNPNSSEIILTEAYHVHYEGLTTSVSPDGYIVQIPTPQDVPARSGDVLAILSGPQAGQWRLIAQVLSPTSYLLDAPITPGSFAVSLSTGFVNDMFLGNTVDARGSSTALDMILAGNQFGVSVVGNHFLGGEYAFRITACPSETPVTWGWTHAPCLGATVNSNKVEGTLYGGLLDVEHAPYITSDAGRVYFSGSFSYNTGVWSAHYLAARSAAGVTAPPVLVAVGDTLSGDPGDLVISATGNTVSGPTAVTSSPTFSVPAATLNGIARRNYGEVLGITTNAQPSPPRSSTPSPPVPVTSAPAPAVPSTPASDPPANVPVASAPVGTGQSIPTAPVSPGPGRLIVMHSVGPWAWPPQGKRTAIVQVPAVPSSWKTVGTTFGHLRPGVPAGPIRPKGGRSGRFNVR